MSGDKWVLESVAMAIHEEQLSEHGGLSGVRDIKLLNSALAKPQNLLSCETPDIGALASAYGYGIARNHPFNDGNEPTAFVVMELFLMLNGYELTADDASCVITMLTVASGDISEDDFAVWIRNHLIKRDK